MEQRLSVVTLGVADLAASVAFYERLGWRRAARAFPSIAFFQCGGMAVALFQRERLAQDAGVPAEGTGFRGVTLAQNVESRQGVGRVLEEAVAAGATLVKPARDAPWGGHSGYFADPDGHLWEVAFNPFVTLRPDGTLELPG